MGHIPASLLLVAAALLQASSHDPLPAPARTAAVALPPARGKLAPAAPRAVELLADKRLAIPVQGVRRSQLRDTFHARRGMGRIHQALDIMAPWGTPVLAADDGRIVRIASNRAGGLALFQVDGSGRLVYYYAHLAGYAEGLREGQAVRRGDVIGYVGATGNAPEHAPHLHFAVMLVVQERRWWGGEAINPYDLLRG